MGRPRRGEVWWVDLEPIRGQELDKTRPVVVVSGDGFRSLALKVVAPLTTLTPSKVGKPWLVPVKATKANGLKQDSAVDVMQVRGVSLGRFSGKLGALTDGDIEQVTAAIAIVIEHE